jgi:tetratricopeptide (TPR) repeat protein
VLTTGGRQVRSVFDLSYRALDGDQRRLFRLLALHPGHDVTAGSAAALLDADPAATAGLLESLLDEHLIEQHVPDRYQPHDLLRAFAHERAHAEESPADRTAAVHRVLAWYLHTADAANRLLFPLGRHLRPDPTRRPHHPRPPRTRGEAQRFFDAEYATLIDAVRLAAEHDLRTVAWQLPAAMWGYFNLHKHWDDWLRTHRTALAAARELADPDAQAWTLTVLGIAHTDLRQYDRALDCCRQALALRRATGDHQGQAITLTVQGITHTRRHEYDQALDCCQQALAVYRSIGDERGQALALNSLADACRRLGRHARALDHLDAAIALQRRIDDRASQRLTLHTLGDTHRDLGRYTDALTSYEQALAICRQVDDPWTTAAILTRRGEIQQELGDRATAHRTWRRALTLYARLGDTAGAATVDRYLAGPSPVQVP